MISVRLEAVCKGDSLPLPQNHLETLGISDESGCLCSQKAYMWLKNRQSVHKQINSLKARGRLVRTLALKVSFEGIGEGGLVSITVRNI